jgi:hypothetical protein
MITTPTTNDSAWSRDEKRIDQGELVVQAPSNFGGLDGRQAARALDRVLAVEG